MPNDYRYNVTDELLEPPVINYENDEITYDIVDAGYALNKANEPLETPAWDF